MHKQWVQEYPHIMGSLRPIHCAQAVGTGISPYSGVQRTKLNGGLPRWLCTNDGYRNIPISWVQYGPYTVYKQWYRNIDIFRGPTDKTQRWVAPLAVHKQWIQEYPHIPGSVRPIHYAIQEYNILFLWIQYGPKNKEISLIRISV